MRTLILAILFLLVTVSSYAAWKAPIEYLSGDWSESDGGFGLEQSESTFNFPKHFCTTTDGYFVIADEYNNRVKIYNGGLLYKIVKSPPDAEQWPARLICVGSRFIVDDYENVSAYNINGNLISTVLERGNIYAYNDTYIAMARKGVYKLLDNSLALIKTSTEPFNEIAYSKKNMIMFNSKAIVVSSKDIGIDFLLSGNNDVIAFGGSGRQLNRYNKCGQVLSAVNLSEDDMVDVGGSEFDEGTTIRNKVVTSPYISRNGDIYEAVASDSGFKIIKYEWVDDATAPTYTPLPPTGIKSTVLDQKIRISWDNAEQDPGCVTGYEIWRSEELNGTYVKLAVITPDLKANFYEYDDSAVVAGKKYYYKIRTVVDNSYSSYSAIADGLIGR